MEGFLLSFRTVFLSNKSLLKCHWGEKFLSTQYRKMFQILYHNSLLISFLPYFTPAVVLLVHLLVFIDCLPIEFKLSHEKDLVYLAYHCIPSVFYNVTCKLGVNKYLQNQWILHLQSSGKDSSLCNFLERVLRKAIWAINFVCNKFFSWWWWRLVMMKMVTSAASAAAVQ